MDVYGRLKLRRAAISQIAGVELHALDELMAATYKGVRERRDKRISELNARLEELGRPPDEQP